MKHSQKKSDKKQAERAEREWQQRQKERAQQPLPGADRLNTPAGTIDLRTGKLTKGNQ